MQYSLQSGGSLLESDCFGINISYSFQKHSMLMPKHVCKINFYLLMKRNSNDTIFPHVK